MALNLLCNIAPHTQPRLSRAWSVTPHTQPNTCRHHRALFTQRTCARCPAGTTGRFVQYMAFVQDLERLHLARSGGGSAGGGALSAPGSPWGGSRGASPAQQQAGGGERAPSVVMEGRGGGGDEALVVRGAGLPPLPPPGLPVSRGGCASSGLGV